MSGRALGGGGGGEQVSGNGRMGWVSEQASEWGERVSE